MLRDLELEDPPASIETDVCIAGGGVAGLILAKQLAAKGFRVAVLEGGGALLETRSQELYDLTYPTLPHVGTKHGRFRAYGGSSTRWGGQLLPFSEEVFAPCAWKGAEGWPLDPEELRRREPEVQSIMGVNELSFSPDADWVPVLRPQALGTAAADVRVRRSKWAPFTKRNLRQTVGRELDASQNASVFLHANVVGIRLEPGGRRVASFTVRDFGNRQVELKARAYVLATSTVEVCRLLLLSGQIEPQAPWNLSGLVGQGLHDHLSVTVGEIDFGSRAAWEKNFAPHYVRRTLHTPKIEANASLCEAHRWNDVMMHFLFDTSRSAFEGLRAALFAMQRGELGTAAALDLLRAAKGAPDLMRVSWKAMVRQRRVLPKGGRVRVNVDCEQLPTLSNRVTLTDERDRVGMPRAQMIWDVGETELRTLFEFYHHCRAHLGALIEPVRWIEFEEPASLKCRIKDTFHLMGGAVMGSDPRRSVVDANLQVHDVSNLFVSSCAVYPSGGTSNPTFSLMCLTLRLASHLERLLS